MFTDEIGDDGTRLLVERVVGSAHVCELRIPAARYYDAPGQQRVLGGNGPVRAVRMPQPVAEVEHPTAVVAVERLPRPIEIRHVDHAVLQAVLVVLGDVPA